MAALESVVGRACTHMQGNSQLPSTVMVEVVNFADYKGKCAQPKAVSLHKSTAEAKKWWQEKS